MGRLIVFEGTEGSGKTTQINLCYEWLKNLGFDVIKTSEPGGTVLGQKLRSLLLESEKGSICSKSELLLFACDRAQHIEEVIKPALAEGKIILCDRYIYSTIAYQYFGRGLSADLIETLNYIATDEIESDLTLWLDIDVSVGLSRKDKPNRIEKEDISFHQRVREGYKFLADNIESFKRIDASLSKHQVFLDIEYALVELMG